jgi:hypothetical protein
MKEYNKKYNEKHKEQIQEYRETNKEKINGKKKNIMKPTRKKIKLNVSVVVKLSNVILKSIKHQRNISS